MEIRIFSTLLASIAVLTGTHFFKRNVKTGHDKTNQLFQGQPQEKETDLGKVQTTLMQKMEPENLTEELELQFKKNFEKMNEDELLPKHAFRLDQVFFILLIDAFGADLVSTISTLYGNMFSPEGLVELAFSFFMSVCIVNIWKKGDDTESDKKTLLKKAPLINDEELIATLMEVKTDLENQRDHTKEQLEEVEREQGGLRQKLQAVEDEIKEKEETFEKPEDLLRERESLQEQRIRLDQKKNDTERQLEKTERLLGPIETKLDRMQRRKILD